MHKGKASNVKLPSGFRPFISMHACYLTFFNLPAIFINTFFLSIIDDVRFTYLYNIILFLIQGGVMMIGPLVLRKIPSRFCARIGIALSSIGYLLLLIFRENSVGIMPLLALTMGSGGAFYWMSFAMLLSDSSDDSNRDKAYSLIGFIGAAVTLIVPFTSGNIIRAFSDSTGYFVVFGMAFAVAVITVLLSARLTERPAEKGKTRFRDALIFIRRTKSARHGYASILTLGLCEGMSGFVMNILLFQMLKNERIVGANTFLTGAAAILANMLCAKILHPGNRAKVFNSSVTVLLAFCLLLLVKIDLYTVILVGMVMAAATALMFNSCNSVFYAVFEHPSGIADRLRPEMFAIKEVVLAVGRIGGILLLYVIPTDFFSCAVGLVILTAAQYVTGAFCRIGAKASKKEREDYN